MVLVPERMGVAISTADGEAVTQWRQDQYRELKWTREKSQVSRCDLTVPFRPGPRVVQWWHWASVWDMDAPRRNGPLWRGPVVGVERDDDTMTLSARDVSVFGQKTRTPITKRWDGKYPATIAAELWNRMLDMRGYDTRMMVNQDPLGDPYDFDTKQNEKKLHQVFDELVKLGLTWTVVGGTPVLGPMPLEPVAVLNRNHLAEHDFKLVQDGSTMCNDLVVRGADDLHRASMPLPGGVILQETLNLDDVFGVSNLIKASKQFLREHMIPRETVVGRRTKLTPSAPIRLEQIVPSARVDIALYGKVTRMELDSLEVVCGPDGDTASIGVEAVNDEPPELDSLYQPGGF